jgi:hypothetical protein
MPFHRYEVPESEIAGQRSERLAIMIVYEDYLTCLLAERLFDRLAARLTRDCEIYLTLRSFDVLAIPALGELAAAEAQQADLVLFAVHAQGKWPSSIENWMGLFVGDIPAQHGGLAALLVQPSPAPPETNARRSTLERLAGRSGRDFFIARDVDWRQP